LLLLLTERAATAAATLAKVDALALVVNVDDEVRGRHTQAHHDVLGVQTLGLADRAEVKVRALRALEARADNRRGLAAVADDVQVHGRLSGGGGGGGSRGGASCRSGRSRGVRRGCSGRRLLLLLALVVVMVAVVVAMSATAALLTTLLALTVLLLLLGDLLQQRAHSRGDSLEGLGEQVRQLADDVVRSVGGSSSGVLGCRGRSGCSVGGSGGSRVGRRAGLGAASRLLLLLLLLGLGLGLGLGCRRGRGGKEVQDVAGCAAHGLGKLVVSHNVDLLTILICWKTAKRREQRKQ
jgi:hypothetical protein